MPAKVFFKVIVPIITGKCFRVCIAISTADGEDNYYSAIFELKGKDGEPIFRCKVVEISCAECKAAGKSETCEHELDKLPDWRDEGTLEIQAAILPKDILLAEMKGERIQKNGPAFAPQLIENLFNDSTNPPVNITTAGTIFLAVDPCGGSELKSKLAIIAFMVREEHVGLFGKQRQLVVSIGSRGHRP